MSKVRKAYKKFIGEHRSPFGMKWGTTGKSYKIKDSMFSYTKKTKAPSKKVTDTKSKSTSSNNAVKSTVKNLFVVDREEEKKKEDKGSVSLATFLKDTKGQYKTEMDARIAWEKRYGGEKKSAESAAVSIDIHGVKKKPAESAAASIDIHGVKKKP